MNARLRFWGLAVLIVFGALTLRGLWLTADPPPEEEVGVVWHDEGAWVHNARNQALVGTWRTDAWNPVFIAPVFTGLEYASFSAFGVGTWQARLVPAGSGIIAIMALMVGLRAVTGRNAALFGGVLLTTSYTFVMWNRAALMESTMTAFIVVSWGAYAVATTTTSRRRVIALGVLAGAAAMAAFFTKAAAAFFVAALVLEVATAWWLTRGLKPSGSIAHPPIAPSPHFPILMGMSAAGALALAILVVPYWAEFQFYNWEMTVTRKPSYGLRDFQDRVTFLLSHGAFSRMWLVLVAASLAALATINRWTAAPPAARLGVLWLLVGLLELIIHDSGNERRYVMFVPVLIALAGMTMRRWGVEGMGRWGDGEMRGWGTGGIVALVAVPLTYLVTGTLLRLVWIDDVRASEYTRTVWTSAGLAAAAGVFCWVYRARVHAWLGRWALGPVAATVIVIVTSGTDLALYTRWAQARTFYNVDASRMLGYMLAPATLVHGKLANGLSLENKIAPVFVGRGFGNYADRLERDDARYILSYTMPEPGYEGDVILDVLQHYPQRRVIAEFDVQQTPGQDRAALIEKFPDGPDPRARNN